MQEIRLLSTSWSIASKPLYHIGEHFNDTKDDIKDELKMYGIKQPSLLHEFQKLYLCFD